MPSMNKDKKWIIHPPQPEYRERLAQALSVSPLLAQLLLNRGISDPERAKLFLGGELEDLCSPWLMKDMHKAVARIKHAIGKKEGICIYGDYDVDGITGTALLSRVLTRLDVPHETYIPQRVSEGYGIHLAALEKLRQREIKLIITVDCGISNQAEIAQAHAWGMDVIITDHHQPPIELPAAHAILNPKQTECNYPDVSLAGVGVAAKLAQALAGEEKGWDVLAEHLDLVCLGTVADVLPLIGENRILVKHGLKRLTDRPKLGISVLKEIAGLSGDEVSVWDIAFRLAPRINAAGRVGDPNVALQLMLTSAVEEAGRIARQLDDENRRRKVIEEQILADCRRQWESKAASGPQGAIVLAAPDWHIGIVGIVASKLVDEYNLPTLLICSKTEPAKGSARSTPGFHLYEALTACQALLVGYGGHQYAAGLTIRQADIPALRDKLNQIALETIKPEDLVRQLTIDGELELDEIRLELMQDIAQLAPFGEANPIPTFCARGVQMIKYPRKVGSNHLKMKLRQGQKIFDSIGFNMGTLHSELCQRINTPIDIAFQPQMNTWQGRSQLQLKLSDIRFG